MPVMKKSSIARRKIGDIHPNGRVSLIFSISPNNLECFNLHQKRRNASCSLTVSVGIFRQLKKYLQVIDKENWDTILFGDTNCDFPNDF